MGGLEQFWQAQLEEERLHMLIDILERVARGLSDANDARELARELGLSHHWRDDEQIKPN